MDRPSRNWKSVRSAALERVERTVIGPLERLFTIYVLVCVFYVVGTIHFHFLDQTTAFTLIEAIQILTVAFAGVLVPILTGSVLILHFASRRLKELVEN